jgi:hypothetical protein
MSTFPEPSTSLKKLDGETIAQLGRDAPVIVYCHDYL